MPISSSDFRDQTMGRSMTPAMRQDEAVLPQLREDLRLIEGSSAPDGSPTWVLIDPAGEELHAVALETDVRYLR